MSLSLFSVTALAEAVDTSLSKAHVLVKCVTGGVTFGQTDVAIDGTGLVEGSIYHNLTSSIWIQNQLTVANNDGSVLMRAGETYDFLLENIYFGMSIDIGDTSIVEMFKQGVISWYYVYSDGTQSAVVEVNIVTDSEQDVFIYNSRTGNHSLKLNIEPEKDIVKVHFIEDSFPHDWLGNYDVTATYGDIDVIAGFDSAMKLTIDKQDKNTGLLEGILGGISDLWKTCESGFANIVKGITELPQKLWELIENGLKNLFVPSEESMTAYKDKWDELLESRLGAVYQVVNVLTDSWDEVMAADQMDSIDFPSATINLAGTPFTFGGYTVQIVPDGFSVLVTAIKGITGIVCTVAFVNGLRKRYDEIMGVEQ